MTLERTIIIIILVPSQSYTYMGVCIGCHIAQGFIRFQRSTSSSSILEASTESSIQSPHGASRSHQKSVDHYYVVLTLPSHGNNMEIGMKEAKLKVGEGNRKRGEHGSLEMATVSILIELRPVILSYTLRPNGLARVSSETNRTLNPGGLEHAPREQK